MDGIGDTLENVGLAQEIQKGLAKSQQKAPKFADWKDEIAAKKAELDAMSEADITAMRLGKNIKKYIDKDLGGGGVKENPMAMDVMAKYLICADKTYAEPVTAKLFEEMRPLGKGAFGAVFLTFRKDTGAPFAVKKMVKTIAKQNHMLKDVLIEREVLSKMRSPFCVNLNYAYQDDVTIYLVLTLCAGGDLAFVLKQQKEKSKEGLAHIDGAVKFYGASMACGLQAIHDAGYVYRDLKPQNVLLDGEGLVRISDMGLTAYVKDGPIKQCSGTRGYWSPETIQKGEYQFEPDWWSLGVTMFVLFSDKLPFHGKDDSEKDAATCKGEMDFKHNEPDDLIAVIKALCTIDHKARLGANGGLEEVKKHAYFSGFDWAALENGMMKVPFEPNPNDINAPSKDEIAAFKKPKDVEWTDSDQAQFKSWDYMDKELWFDEAVFRIKKYKELSKGGGGCCTIA